MGILSKLVVAATGTLPADTASIKKWVEANGGKWSARVDKRVTHLVASKEAWKKVTDPVLQASELGIHIVSYDWLEDSLQGKRKLAEKKYTWDSIKKDRKRTRELKKLGAMVDSKKFVEGCEKIKELTGSGTSKKLPPARKPKASKSFFFTPNISTPFVSAKDDLIRRRAEREAAEAVEAPEAPEKAAKAAKKSSFAGTVQAPIQIEDDIPDPSIVSTLPTPPSSASSIESVLKHRASPDSPTPSVTASIVAGPQAKITSIKDLYHFYLDSTGFEYKITLVRSNFELNCIVRYQLSILESHTTPHTYCTHVQYTPQPVTGVPESTKSLSDAQIRNPLLNFLRRSDQQAENEHPTTHNSMLSSNEASRLRSLTTPLEDRPIDPAEKERLHSLITPITPNPTTPFKTLVCPMNSSFATAWRTFRHVFRDLTLLSWEERFDTLKILQTVRAKFLNIEPYVYSKPKLGLPVGLRVQEAGLHQGSAGETLILGDAEDGYVRNEFSLPGLDERVSRGGVIGSAIWREEEESRKRVEEKKVKVEERIRKEKGKVQEKKRVNYNKPLFNGVMGRPRQQGGSATTRADVHAGIMRENRRFAKSNAMWGYEE
jgi:hypothetical protein